MFDALLNWVLDLLEWVLGQLDQVIPEVPDWFSQASAAIASFMSYADGMSRWIPFDVVAVVVPGFLVLVAIGFGVKLVRIVASFLTAGGGSSG